MTPKHPEVHVKLGGEDGNAFAILGRCRAVMVAHRMSQDEIDAFFAEATRGDYHDLLATCMRWFDVE